MTEASTRIVGIDFGTRRVGIAVSDPLQLFAQPHGTFPPDEALGELERIHASDGIEAIVLGWPLAPDGTEGEAVERVKPFQKRITNRLPDVRVVRWDERESSRRATAAMVEAGTRRSQRRDRGRVDRAAAAVILQEYLDERDTRRIREEA